LTFAYKAQTTYKEPLDLHDRVQGWKFVLEEDFSVDQVMFGLKKFMKTNTNMPVPADIANALGAANTEITITQFKHAQEQWKISGYSTFSDHLDVIKAYEKQGVVKAKDKEIQNEDLLKIAASVVKRIGG